MGKHTDTWKRAERITARDLGGARTGNTGRPAADAANGWAVCEVKTRKELPKWLKEAVRQAEGAATMYTAARLPLVRLHEVGGRYVDDLIVTTVSAFFAWFGDYRGRGDEEL